MCTKDYHDQVRKDWVRFDQQTEPGFIQRCAGFVFETRHCRRCRSSLAHPRDMARYAIG